MKIEKVVEVRTDAMDLLYVVRRRGARVVIDADTEAQARMVVRRIDAILAPKTEGDQDREAIESQAIGFRVADEE